MTTESKRDLFAMTVFSLLFLVFYQIGKSFDGAISLIFYALTAACALTIVLISESMGKRNKSKKELIYLQQERREMSAESTKLQEIKEFLKTPQAKNLFGEKYKEIVSDINFHASKIKEMIDNQDTEIINTYEQIKKVST
jgi:hypothetical protein